VLLFTLFAGAASGIVSGFAPAFFASRTHLNEALKESGRAASSGVRRHGTRNAFVVAQIVLAIVLLVGAQLMVKGLRLVTEPAPGLDAAHALTMRMTLPNVNYPSAPQRDVFQRRVLAAASALPGVSEAALVHNLPYSNYRGSVTLTIAGQPQSPNGYSTGAQDQSASPAYFHALHLPLVSGRSFTEHDAANAPPVAIINQTFARRHFPNESPLGKELKLGKPDSANPWLTIVGVVADIRMDPFETSYPQILYRPIAQAAPFSFCLLLRSAEPRNLTAATRAVVHSVDPSQPVYNEMTLAKVFDVQLSPVNLIAGLMASFGVLALVLSSVGVYSILTHTVAERTHEIGVRMALGAMSSEVVRLFIRQSMILAGAGVVLGLPAAFGLAHLLEHMFFGVTASDPWTFATALLVIAATALIASYSATRRAAQLDPAVTLREE
jgi:putative ABC transport system permease protein